MNTIDKGQVTCQISQGVGTIEFGHPGSNSLPGRILEKLAQAITEFGKNDEVKVIILKSSGDRTFCAGASFDELISIGDHPTGKAFFMGFARVINAARKCPKFIIGRVQGKAVGGGVGIACAVDYCMATQFASVKLSELSIGIGPFIVGPVIERKIGTSAMTELAINATEWRTAEWAQTKGMYLEVFGSAEAMDEAISGLAARLALSNPEAMKLLKETFWKGTEDWDELLERRAEMSGKLVLSDFAVNAINAFRQKS